MRTQSRIRAGFHALTDSGGRSVHARNRDIPTVGVGLIAISCLEPIII